MIKSTLEVFRKELDLQIACLEAYYNPQIFRHKEKSILYNDLKKVHEKVVKSIEICSKIQSKISQTDPKKLRKIKKLYEKLNIDKSYISILDNLPSLKEENIMNKTIYELQKETYMFSIGLTQLYQYCLNLKKYYVFFDLGLKAIDKQNKEILWKVIK